MRITEDPRRIPILKTKSKMTRGKSNIMKKRTHQETPVNLNNKGKWLRGNTDDQGDIKNSKVAGREYTSWKKGTKA